MLVDRPYKSHVATSITKNIIILRLSYLEYMTWFRTINKVAQMAGVQRFSSTLSQAYEDEDLGSSPGLLRQ